MDTTSMETMHDFYPALVLVAYALVALCALVVMTSTVKIAREYERGVVFRLGRLIPLKGRGLFFIFPFGIDHLRKVDLRVVTLEVAQQEVITSDNVTVKVNAVIFFQVADAQAAIVRVANYPHAGSRLEAEQAPMLVDDRVSKCHAATAGTRAPVTFARLNPAHVRLLPPHIGRTRG
jgi:regulator of protease activity HflC (stomatin/prohibitin superfamily)